MAESKLTKKVLVVNGMPSSKAVIQFTGDETWYEISQKVQGYDLVKYGIVKGATVDATFDTANQVVYLKVKDLSKVQTPQAQTSAPATEQQTSAPATTAGDTKLWTVKAIAKNNKVIKFEESGNPWDNLSPEIEKLNLKAIGVVPKAKVLVTFDGNNVVTAISKSAEEPAPSTDTSSDNSTFYKSDSTNDSIQRQVCLKEAGAMARSLIETASSEVNSVEKIKNVLKDLMKACLEAMNL